MNIALYTIGFVALLGSIVAFLLHVVNEYPLRSEPELLVVDAPADEAEAEETAAEAQWAR